MLVTGEIYHILNRGTEGRIIYQTKRDYERFLLTVLECNDLGFSMGARHRRVNCPTSDVGQQPLVEILAITLMPNHYHIVVKQLVDSGIAKLMQRVGNSYTKYFNIKNDRKGTLFMSGYKNIHVNTDSQIQHLIAYVHANPLDLVMPEWRNGNLENYKKAKEYLENYKWSSYNFYAKDKGVDIISQIITKETVDIFYPDPKDHFGAIRSWSGRSFGEN